MLHFSHVVDLNNEFSKYFLLFVDLSVQTVVHVLSDDVSSRSVLYSLLRHEGLSDLLLVVAVLVPGPVLAVVHHHVVRLPPGGSRRNK